jgi:hypothetical protein
MVKKSMEISMKKIILLLLIFSSCIISCSGKTESTLPGVQSSSSATLLFQDDFSNPDSGWDRLNNVDGIIDYVKGQYQIEVDRANYDYFATSSHSFSDVHIEVEATRNSGDVNNNFGVICRYLGKNDFYVGMISSDGFFGIFKVINGEYHLIGMDSMAKSDSIKQDSETNLIRFDCKGNTLTLYANGTQLDSRQDADLSQGDVGLLAGTNKNPGVKISFDNFKVYQP